MSGSRDTVEPVELPPNARILGSLAIMAGLIGSAAENFFAATQAETVVSLFRQIEESAASIRTAVEMADALGCGPETVEAVKQGHGRVNAFRVCQGLEGSA